MKGIDRRLTPEQDALLARTKGARLLAIDTTIDSTCSWETVRLHFEGFDIDINNLYENIDLGGGDIVDEFGAMSVREGTPEKLRIPEIRHDPYVCDIDRTVISVHVANAKVDIYESGVLTEKWRYAWAVVFETVAGFIVIDTSPCFSCLTHVRKYGKTLEELLYDEARTWEDDPYESPTEHYDYRTEIYEL